MTYSSGSLVMMNCRSFTFEGGAPLQVAPQSSLRLDCGGRKLELYTANGTTSLGERSQLHLVSCHVMPFESAEGAESLPQTVELPQHVFGNPLGAVVLLENSTLQLPCLVRLIQAYCRDIVPYHRQCLGVFKLTSTQKLEASQACKPEKVHHPIVKNPPNPSNRSG
jgi:hypothetical protein